MTPREGRPDAARAEALDEVAAGATFLAHVFLRPDAAGAALASLTDEVLGTWPFRGDADSDAGLELLAASAAMPESEEALRADYAALFVGPGTMLACPYASVHTGEEGLVFDLDTLDVRAAYAEFGLGAPEKEPDDHIGLELAFVAELALAALGALEAGDDAGAEAAEAGAQRFVADHLGWASEFAGFVVERAGTAFYRGAGYLLRGAVRRLMQWAGAPSAP